MEADAKVGLAGRAGSTYQSGGRNPNWQLCCGTCKYMLVDRRFTSHGWCQFHGNGSVSITGGCENHSDSPNSGMNESDRS